MEQPDRERGTPADRGATQFAGIAVDRLGAPGAADAPPLLFVHGLSFDRRTWAPAIEAFRSIDDDRQLLVVDLPGHGASAALPVHTTEAVVDALHAAVIEAEMGPPVVVAHSIGAVLATLYATRHPSAGVVNVDQSLDVEGFAVLLHSVAERLRGPDFPELWTMIEASFHIELLPAEAQVVVRETSNAQQAVVLSYWQELLDLAPADLPAWGLRNAELLRGIECPYSFLAGREPDPNTERYLHDAVPHATTTVWAGTGHFPHLAHPGRFAEMLAATASWPSRGPTSFPATS